MSAPYNPPTKNQDFIIGIGLEDMSSVGTLRVNPTIASGDFKVSIDFGTFNNLATLPSVVPSSGRQVKIELSSTEMNGDVISIQGVDQTSPKEWADFFLTIPTTT